MARYPIHQLPGRYIAIDGTNWLYFSGTSYLGMGTNQTFRALVQEGMRHYGTNFGGSRRSNTPLVVFEELEAFLAEWSGAPAALTLSSGTLAGQLATQGFQGEVPMFCAPTVHPAILPQGVQPSKLTYQEWSRRLIEELRERRPPRCIVYSNALDPLFAETYDWSWLAAIPEDCRVQLLVDDSHGLGITGPNGAGRYTMLKQQEQIDLLLVASMGKAFGIPAGVVFGEREMLGGLQRSAQFGGASPPIPAYCYAFLRAQALYAEARAVLRANVERFVDAVGGTGLFRYLDQFPVFYTPHQELASFLSDHQIMISSFPYPSPEEESITRIVISSCHRPEDIERLAELVLEFYHTLD